MHHMDDDKNAQLYQALCTGLPSPIVGAEQPKSLLLVFLAEFDDIHEKKLVDHLQPSASEFKILTWHPSHRVLQSLAPQRQHRDSKANLYGLAIVAHRNGHSGFLVADELTKRQVEGRFPLRGEDERISVGMIAVRQSKQQGGQLRVIAKRSAMANDENFALLAAVDNFEIFPDFENPQRVERVTTIYSVLGLQLHDPDRPVFTPGTANPMGYEEVSSDAMGAISMNTPLPPELALDVTSRAEKNMEEPINFPPGLDFQDSKRSINVLLGFQSTENERSSMLTALKSAVHHEFEKKSGKQKKGVKRKAAAKQENINTRGGDDPVVTSDTSREAQHDPSVYLIPWEHARPLSRRHILDLPQAVIQYADSKKRQRLPYLLMKPLEHRNIASTELLSVHDTRMGLAVCRTTLDKIVLNEQAKPSTSDMASCYEKEQVELLPPTCIKSGFDEPLYPISHPWNAIGRLNAIPLFFLTNKLSEEQTRALYEEIQTMNHIDEDDWGKKIICPVPWKEDEPDAEDGTPADMWRIYTEVDDSCELPLVFADQQSGEDLRIIMTDKIYVSYSLEDEEACELLKGVKDPAHRGITYGRLPGRDAHITWVNLNIANMDIDESFNDENQCENYLRPDWPCHDRVGEYNEWVPRGEEEEEEQTKAQSDEDEI